MSTPSPDRPRSGWRRFVRALLIYAGIPYCVVTIGFVALQRRILYPVSQVDDIAVPRSTVGEVSEVVLTAHDGLTLHGWKLTAPTDAADRPSAPDGAPEPQTASRFLVLCFPGNSADRRSRLGEMEEFRRLGADVLLVDYRGYGDNPGSPTEADLSQDARTVWRYAVGEMQFRPQQIALFGESLGGAVATRLAADCCRADTSPAALVVSSTFDSLPSVVARKYPAFPFRWLLFDTYRSDLAIRDVTCPITILHGEADELTPVEHARRLFAAAPEHSSTGIAKRLVVLPGRGHNDLPVDVLAEAISQRRRTPDE